MAYLHGALARIPLPYSLLALALPLTQCGGETTLLGVTEPATTGSTVDAGLDGATSTPTPPGNDASSTFPGPPSTADASIPTPSTAVCPGPTVVQPQGACGTPGMLCSSQPTQCAGTVTLQCTCAAGQWSCGDFGCSVPTPPPDVCAVNGKCSVLGEGCTLASQGPCGSDVLLQCSPATGLYEVLDFPCSTGSGGAGVTGCGWGGAGPGGCTESCQCTNGSMVCMGTCPDGGLAMP